MIPNRFVFKYNAITYYQLRFRMAAFLMNLNLSADGKITDTCADPFTREQLYEKIVELLLGKDDDEMSAMGYPQANMLIPTVPHAKCYGVLGNPRRYLQGNKWKH